MDDRILSIAELPYQQEIAIVLIGARFPMLMKRHAIIVGVVRRSDYLDVAERHLNVFVALEIGTKVLDILRLVLYGVLDFVFHYRHITFPRVLHLYGGGDDDGIITEYPVNGINVFLIIETAVVLHDTENRGAVPSR